MKTASWILLALAGALTLLGAVGSIVVAYASVEDDQIGPVTLSDLAAGRPDVAAALKARRATAASYAAGFATLILATTLGPYRRGDVWAWWALLLGTVVMSALSLLRVPFIDTRAGAGTALVTLVVVGLGLALDAGRLRAPAPRA
jgi:hypothetical protein